VIFLVVQEIKYVGNLTNLVFDEVKQVKISQSKVEENLKALS